ncbi:hypothetical protein CSC88_35160 [Klebsiella pneumoniae]|nr:hypothetical protein CSC88_35160 [Klebsiella pneumoniae]
MWLRGQPRRRAGTVRREERMDVCLEGTQPLGGYRQDSLAAEDAPTLANWGLDPYSAGRAE